MEPHRRKGKMAGKRKSKRQRDRLTERQRENRDKEIRDTLRHTERWMHVEEIVWKKGKKKERQRSRETRSSQDPRRMRQSKKERCGGRRKD